MYLPYLVLGALLAVAPLLPAGEVPPVPDREGFASPFAGTSHGVLLAAGGANIPGEKWQATFLKQWYDTIYALVGGKWMPGGVLPHRCAYGVSVTDRDEVICCGGSDVSQHFADCYRLAWDGTTTAITPLPPLPEACANCCGAIVQGVLYLAGGLSTPSATTAMHNFWALDLRDPQAKWKVLEPWPGAPRMLAVAGATPEAFYLFSGASLSAGKDGAAVREYLIDAWCYHPEKGWSRLPDLPRPAVAAPSPAPLLGGDKLALISGDDGLNVHFEPVEKHPGFPRTTLIFDTIGKSWAVRGDAPSRATAPVVKWDGAWAIVNGEVRPRVRTPQIQRWSGAE
jgi:N-acetylneuraminic acid mutarotase